MGDHAQGVGIQIPADYLALSPLYRVLDALTLLSVQQTIALIVSFAVLVIAWLVLTQRKVSRPLWKRLAIALPLLIGAVATLEAAAAFLPRGMLALRAIDPDIVIVDFHSHTGTSHDVRKSVTAEDNREWHRSGGFDIAYITDHVKFAGAVAGRAGNPAKAGEGTSLLIGVEGRYHRIISTIVLGVSERDSALFDKRGNLLSNAYSTDLAPVTMIALPSRNLDSLTAAVLDSAVALPNLAAIELVDAAPRGLAQLDREETRIRRVATDLGLALVAASNNHGYGRTVAGWNLMRVAGWRGLPPDSAGLLIEQQFRERKPEGVTLIRRNRPTVHGPAVAAILPVLTYQTIGSLTLPERIAWVGWIWVTFALMSFRRKRKRA